MAISKLELEYLEEIFQDFYEALGEDEAGLIWDLEQKIEDGLAIIRRELNEQK